jgi:hypothetical protein
MLTDILARFEEKPAGLCLEEVADDLELEIGTLQGMMQTLVRLGRLEEVSQPGGCAACPLTEACTLQPGEVRRIFQIPSP